MKKILTKSITTIMYLLLITLLSNSCTKENTIAPKQQSKITIRVEDYGGADVKSSTQTSPIYTDAFRLNDKYFATMQLIEDQGQAQATNHALTKADNYNYTILVFDSGNKLVQKVEGTVTNGEGDFTIDYNKTTGKIKTAGEYKFVCVANGTLNNVNIGSNAASITFTRQKDISKPALISDVLTKTITDAQVNSNTVPDLDFLMRHKESGLRVKIVSEAEDIPSGLKVNLNLQSAEPNTAKYNLPDGINTPTTTTSAQQVITFPGISAAGTKEFTTDYLYFLEKTGLNKDLKLTYTDATNKTLGGVNLSKLTTDLFNLPELKANRRYTVVVTFTPVEYNNLTREQIMELPAWRFAPRNLNPAGTDLAADDLITSSGYFKYSEVKDKILTLYGKKYHLPSYEEYVGIVHEGRGRSNQVRFDVDIVPYTINEYVTYGTTVSKLYKASYWNAQRTVDNAVIKYDGYGIKLYTDTDYSHACAYRYKWYNYNTTSAYLEIKAVYLGNDAKYYLNLKDKTELQNLIDNPIDKIFTTLKFPSCGTYSRSNKTYYYRNMYGYHLINTRPVEGNENFPYVLATYETLGTINPVLFGNNGFSARLCF